MLLVIDCGNTNTEFGLYNKLDCRDTSRFTTSELGTASECALSVDWFLARNSLTSSDISAVVIGSVVPHVTGQLIEMSTKYFDCQPVVITSQSKLGIKILYENPQEVGTDRLVGALAAHELYGGSCIIVDFGTATTFDVITEQGEYLGGIICPGMQSSALSLSRKAAQLFNVDLQPPKTIIGRTTEDSIKSGLIFGTATMVDGFVLKISEELQQDCKVIATGGFADRIAQHSKVIDTINPNLVLDGLAMAYAIITI